MRPREYLIPIYLWISASLLLHMVFAGGTKAIADRVGGDAPRLLARAGSGSLNASEVEFDFPAEAQPPPAADPTATPTPPTPSTTPPDHVRTPRGRRRPDRRPEPEPDDHLRPTTPPPPVPVPAVPVPAPPPVPRADQQYVDQTNPSEEPVPTDPHFLAQSNRDVQEETQAAVRNLERDQANPRAGGAPDRSDPQHPGRQREPVSADLENREGRRDRVPNDGPRTPQHVAAAAVRPNPSPATPGSRSPGTGGTPTTSGAVGRTGAAGDPVPGAGGAMVVAGGAQGNNGQNGGGANRDNAGGLAGIRGAGASRALTAMLPSWNSYAAVIGDARMEREADEARRRRSEARGSYTDGWQDTRAAIENFVPHVRVGNQTALRTAASPFAAYLTAMHRRIHRLFADGFIAGLQSAPASSPLQNEGLVTTLEIVLDGSGAVHSLGVVHPSGVLPFDVAAINSVRRAAPFGEAPAAIRSGDGRVYMRWGFHRDHRQCGTFNAEPFILPGPAATPPGRPPLPAPRSPDVGPGERLGDARGATEGPGSPG